MCHAADFAAEQAARYVERAREAPAEPLHLVWRVLSQGREEADGRGR